MFRPYLPRGGSRAGQKWVTGVPILKKCFLAQKATATNRMHSNDLEACGMKVCCFWFHSDVKFLTRSLYSGERQWPTWASCLSSLQPLNEFWCNSSGSKYSTSSTEFVFFGPIRQQRWSPRSVVCWNIFDFSSSVEQILTKHDKKQVLNVFQVSLVFRFANPVCCLHVIWR